MGFEESGRMKSGPYDGFRARDLLGWNCDFAICSCSMLAASCSIAFKTRCK